VVESPLMENVVVAPPQEKPVVTEPFKSELSQPIRNETARPKTTLNLGNILRPSLKQEEKIAEGKNGAVTSNDQPVTEKQVKEAWTEYAAERKSQVAEYHLLNREITFRNSQITIPLTNPIEEPLLLSIKSNLVDYLRRKLSNNLIQVVSIIEERQSKKVAYTNKDKFEHLAEKNPLLNQLKEKFGLDTDF
jgi:hypothetical protein